MQLSLQWAAGLFEGEGSFSIRNDNSRGHLYRRPVAQVKSTDEDVVRSFHAIVKVGSVSGPFAYKSNPEYKPYWHWQVSRPVDFTFFCMLMYPLMHTRRQQRVREIADELGYEQLVAAILEEENAA